VNAGVTVLTPWVVFEDAADKADGRDFSGGILARTFRQHKTTKRVTNADPVLQGDNATIPDAGAPPKIRT